MNINRAILYGNLTRDPELRSLPSGNKLASFGLATNRRYKDQSGAWKDTAEFHNLIAFGRPAEVIAQYLKKGRPVFVEGRIQTRSWDDQQSGQKKYRTEIVVESFQFGPDGRGAQGGAGSRPQNQNDTDTSGQKSAPDAKSGEDEAIQYPDEDINSEDIPF